MTVPAIDQLDTFPKLLLHNAANWGDEVAMREKEFGIWNSFTWSMVRDRSRVIALGLKSLGVARGDTVALLGRNRPNWIWSELAAHSIGATTIGIYEDVLATEAGYLLEHSDTRLVICEDEEQVDKVLEFGDSGQAITHIVYHDDRGMRKYDDPRLVSWADLLARGNELGAASPDLFEAEIASGRGADVAILCTTSGTTSHPKLAMLQFKPLLIHVAAYLEAEPRAAADEYVSLLPLPWIVEQVFAVVMPLLSRIKVSFPESAETAMRDLREIGPTHVLLAPRVWEQLAADVRARIMDSGPLTRNVFATAVRMGVRAVENGRRSGLADLMLFGTLRDRLGFSRVKAAATGGSALGPDTFKFFLAMGVPLRQLYGQTELAGAYTLQRGGRDVDCDSSGLPFSDTEVRIDQPDENGVGEILTRHAGMFKGYYRNPEATVETMTEDGWIKTGDAGYFDSKKRLVVIDRVRDIATTAQGVRFSPQFIENKLKFSPYIGECVIVGHGREFLVAILCIRYSMVSKWAEANRIGFTTYQNLSANSSVADLLGGEVQRVNATLPEAHQIRRYLLLYKELDPDDGELTRTRKVRRGVIDERYGSLIDALFDGSEHVHVETEVTFEDGRKGRIVADLAIHDCTQFPASVATAA